LIHRSIPKKLRWDDEVHVTFARPTGPLQRQTVAPNGAVISEYSLAERCCRTL
jgi:hypothetical protein